MSREGPLPRVATGLDLPTVIAAAMPPVQRARLSDALRGKVTFHWVESLQGLPPFLRSIVAPVDVAVISAQDATAVEGARLVRDLARERPRMAIVAYVRASADHSATIRALAGAGVHQFVFFGTDDGGAALREILSRARAQCAAEWILVRLSPIIPSLLHPMIEAAVAHPETITTVSKLADAMGVQRNTLFNWCRRAKFLVPEEVLGWVRLAVVGYYLETTGCTVERIALDLGFASDTALRNAIKRYTGLRATDLRGADGLATVLSALQRRLIEGPLRRGKLHVG